MTLTKLPKDGKVAVLGAGILGLTFTYFLSKLRPDLHFTIYEKTQRPGGWMFSPTLHVKDTGEKIMLEKGPRTLRGVKDGSLLMIDILQNLGLKNQVEVINKSSPANKKYITDSQGEIVQVPNSIASTVKFLKQVKAFDWKLLRGIVFEPFVKPYNGDETVEQFFKRRFKSTIITDNVASAIMHGVYAGDIGKLSIKSILPALKEIEHESGSIVKHVLQQILKLKTKPKPKLNGTTKDGEIDSKQKVQKLSELLQTYEQLLSPQANLLLLQKRLKDYPMIKLHDGMDALPRHLAQYLIQNTNTVIKYNAPIESCDPVSGLVNGEKFDHIRSTINTHSLANSLPANNPLVPQLNSIQYVSIFLTNLFTRELLLIPQGKPGFGFLRPRYRNVSNNPQALLGTIYDSDIENHVQGLFNDSKPVRNKYNKITIMMGGHYYSHWSIPSNKLNLKIVEDVLAEKLKVDVSRLNVKAVTISEGKRDTEIDTIKDNDLVISYSLHSQCIPQYNLGYQETKAKVLEILNKENYKLSFGGTVFAGGLGVPDCVESSLVDALQLK